MYNIKHVSAAVYSCKLSESKPKWSLEVHHRSLVECGALSAGKSDSPQENVCFLFRTEQWKDNGGLFKTLETSTCFINHNYLFPDQIKIFKVPTFSITISTFICWKTSYFPDFLVLLCVVIILIFISRNVPSVSSYLLFEKPFLFMSFCSYFPLKLIALRNTVF